MIDPSAHPEPAPGAPDWFVTYADLMTLLLAFFVMLASMSELKSEQRVVETVESMQKHFGPGSRGGGERIDAGRGRRPGVRPEDGGVPPTTAPAHPDRAAPIGERFYFAEDSAQLADGEQAKLRLIAEQFQGKLQRIEIRGHTTCRPLPAGSPYGDHWDLAFARCRSVAAALSAAGIEVRRFRYGVAGGNEPAASGDDPVVRRENSRVEVFLLNEFNDDRGNSAAVAGSAPGGGNPPPGPGNPGPEAVSPAGAAPAEATLPVGGNPLPGGG